MPCHFPREVNLNGCVPKLETLWTLILVGNQWDLGSSNFETHPSEANMLKVRYQSIIALMNDFVLFYRSISKEIRWHYRACLKFEVQLPRNPITNTLLYANTMSNKYIEPTMVIPWWLPKNERWLYVDTDVICLDLGLRQKVSCLCIDYHPIKEY